MYVGAIKGYMSCSLDSLKGVSIGDYLGFRVRIYIYIGGVPKIRVRDSTPRNGKSNGQENGQ